MESTPLVFDYSDFREFLRDSYAEKRLQNSKFSHRYITRKSGATSSGWFSDILKGRINLSDAHLFRLMAVFGLANQDAAFFETLVRYNQASSIEERNHHFRKLLSCRAWGGDMVGEERFEYYRKWYYSAIRELLFFYEFKGNYASLARKMRPPISPKQAKEAIALLIRLGFLKKQPGGVYRPEETTLRKNPAFKSLHTANYLKAYAELGMHALDQVEKSSRHISAMTIPLSPGSFAKALGELETLRNRLLMLTEEEETPQTVYQLNLQFFPITE